MASAAQVALAFETLRNPAKRRAYDASLGIGTPAKRLSAPPAVSFRISARPDGDGAHVEQHLGERLRPAPPPSAPEIAPPEPRVASFIASSLREIASPEPLDGPIEMKSPRQEQQQPNEAAFVEPKDAGEAEHKVLRLKPAAAAAGGLILAAGVIGMLAGLSRGEPEPQQAAVTLPVPPPTPHPRTIVPAAVSTPSAKPVEARQQLAASVPDPSAAEALHRGAAAKIVGRATARRKPAGRRAAPPAVAQDAATTDELRLTSGYQPRRLRPACRCRKAVIARTIERIGYSCGDVSSTTAVEGAGPGAYKVTCTSGQSYEAKPVRGRYHFRRLKP